VTARDHTAPITLGRGGTVRVCQTSALHVTESKSAETSAPLLFSLDRGAIEIEMSGTLNDAIMTPDLRFTVVNKGPLDLRLRVARNGDTCVENRGANAPTLNISDPFGEALYQVGPGQHVMFEHGNLHEVVDHENSPCGCPDRGGLSIADALLASGGPTPAVKAPAPATAAQPVAPVAVQATVPAPAQPDPQAQLQTAEQAAAQAAMRAAEEKHPFPAAISEGLAPAAEVPQATPGAPHVQISDTLSYNAPAPAAAAGPAAAAPAAKSKKAKAGKSSPAVGPAGQAATPPPPPPNDLVHVVGRFFKRLFGG
jgi:pyruvate/2-oxoglutarate dehydrogenase complex dihydrolipoamide acyltransferase (E2) component